MVRRRRSEMHRAKETSISPRGAPGGPLHSLSCQTLPISGALLAPAAGRTRAVLGRPRRALDLRHAHTHSGRPISKIQPGALESMSRLQQCLQCPSGRLRLLNMPEGRPEGGGASDLARGVSATFDFELDSRSGMMRNFHRRYAQSRRQG